MRLLTCYVQCGRALSIKRVPACMPNHMQFSQHVCLQFKPVVFDAVYTPLETRLLREAAQTGCVCVNGLDMFVGQAAAQFKYFTGLDPPVELMRDTVLQSLSK